LQLLDAPMGVLAYERSLDGDDDDETLTVAINFTTEPIRYPRSGEIALSSIATRQRGQFGGELAPDEAVILRA
jgi:hypothetical protein